MDIKIENNDIALYKNGSPKLVSGINLAVQQVNLAFKIPFGSFIYDRRMGAFNEMDFSEINIEKKLESFINEALIHTDICVTVNYIARNSQNTVIGLSVDTGYENTETEVMVNG